MAGEYRALLQGTPYAHIRLARTDRPAIGVRYRRDLTCELIALFKAEGSPIALEYAKKLADGQCVPITEDHPHNSDGGTGNYATYAGRGNKYWSPGELFFRS